MNLLSASRYTRCDECEAEEVAVVQLGEVMTAESSTAWICLPCLRRAVALAEGRELPAKRVDALAPLPSPIAGWGDGLHLLCDDGTRLGKAFQRDWVVCEYGTYRTLRTGTISKGAYPELGPALWDHGRRCVEAWVRTYYPTATWLPGASVDDETSP